jgi:hypothetical protein
MFSSPVIEVEKGPWDDCGVPAAEAASQRYQDAVVDDFEVHGIPRVTQESLAE